MKFDLTCPFNGDNFNNFKCIFCNLTPLNLNYLADGIVCPECENIETKNFNMKCGRYVKLNDHPNEIILYTKEIEKYLNS